MKASHNHLSTNPTW